MTIDITQARAHIDALTGGRSATTELDFRCLHDQRKDLPGVPVRGTIDQCIAFLNHWNNEHYGIFLVVSETDGAGLHNTNMTAARANYTDLDEADAPGRYAQALGWQPTPSFAVLTSTGRAHLYWPVQRHADWATHGLIQRKLVTMFNGDPACIDPARVLRLAGSINWKREQPVIATFVPLAGAATTTQVLEFALSGVVADAGGGDRVALGEDADKSAPSLDWAVYALNKFEPDGLDRADWLKITAAFKASAWVHGADAARKAWDAWCAQYQSNDIAENDKLWGSIADTKTGWGFLAREANILAEVALAGKPLLGSLAGQVSLAKPVNDGQPAPAAPRPILSPSEVIAAVNAPIVQPLPAALSEPYRPDGWLVSPDEQAKYFAGCISVINLGRILTPQGRLLDQQRFNMDYGGYAFVVNAEGKVDDNAWKAATNGQVFRIGKVDHLRFLPRGEHGQTVVDEFGRKGVNTYQPARVSFIEGDASPFINHLRRILPTELDLRILLSYFAHIVQRPGFKVPWAPLIQSTEGAGKGVIKLVMSYAVGGVYTHSPNAKELTEGGGKFNGWLENKLLIICDEIKVYDDRNDLIEVLKPMISELRLEMQRKGQDQDYGDNPANWIFFTNYKDAVPVSRNGRRWAPMFSPMQTAEDLLAAGMDGAYFKQLYDWLNADGAAICAWFLKNYPIEPEFDPAGIAQRAPVTSSWREALVQSRSKAEQLVHEAVEGHEPGFRGGYMSSWALAQRLNRGGVRTMAPAALKRLVEAVGFVELGRANRAYTQEDPLSRSMIYVAKGSTGLTLDGYSVAQGYAL